MFRSLWGCILFVAISFDSFSWASSRIQLGPSLTVIDYNQTGTEQTTQIWLGLEGQYQSDLSTDWKIDAIGKVGALPLSKTTSRYNLRAVSVAGQASYLGWNQSGEGIFPQLGYQYQTIINQDRFGYRNIHGPTVGLKLKFLKGEKNDLVIEQGLGLLLTDSSISLGNSELLLKLSYGFTSLESWVSQLRLSLQASRLSLSFRDGEVGAYFYSFNISGSF